MAWVFLVSNNMSPPEYRSLWYAQRKKAARQQKQVCDKHPAAVVSTSLLRALKGALWDLSLTCIWCLEAMWNKSSWHLKACWAVLSLLTSEKIHWEAGNLKLPSPTEESNDDAAFETEELASWNSDTLLSTGSAKSNARYLTLGHFHVEVVSVDVRNPAKFSHCQYKSCPGCYLPLWKCKYYSHDI